MWTHRLAVATATLTVGLLLVGGLVHGTGSSLACPDWPLCFGQYFPKMEGGVLVEHGHRLFAGSVALLTLTLCVVGFLEQKRALIHRLGLAAVGLVLFQALLGGLTVIYKLPTLISWAHLCTSMLFLSIVVIESRLTRPGALRTETPWPRYLLVLGTALLCYVQIALGGLVRHTGGGLACQDLILCKGTLLPLDGHPTAFIHALHRINAVLVAGLVVTCAVVLRRESAFVRRLALGLVGLVVVQIALGLLSVASYLGLFYVTAHLGVAALVLSGLVTLCVELRPSPLAATATASDHAAVEGQAA